MNPNSTPGGLAPAKWFFTVDDQRIPAPLQQISEAILRAQASVPADRVLVRDHNSADDEVIAADSSVNLVDGNVFYTVARYDARPPAPCKAPAKLALSVDDEVEEILSGHQTGQSVRDLFEIKSDHALYRDHESPVDQAIGPKDAVHYGDGPVFYTRAVHEFVEIKIDAKPYKIKAGDHAVTELKQIGGVPVTLQLDQIINGTFVPLADTATVCITGGEVFISHPRDGGSS
jgi:hypothetical protein